MLRLGAELRKLSGSEFQVDGPQQQNTDDRFNSQTTQK